MIASESFQAVMGRQRLGDEAAAAEIVARFADRLVGVTVRHLDRRLRQKVDAEDVVQSAYGSFFVRHRDGRLDVDGWQGLWKLLLVITLRKCADRAEHFRAARRDVGREAAAPAREAVIAAPGGAPDEAAMLAETVDDLRAALSPDELPVLELSLQGYTATEICERLGRAERTVRRVRERVRKRLELLRLQG